MKKILSFVGNHNISIYDGCNYDESIRKYKGGHLIGVIPFSGTMLNAEIKQIGESSIDNGSFSLRIKSKPEYIGVDDIPSEDICDFCIVSNIYAAACKELGKDTSRLLTIGGTVVDENGKTIGVCYFNRN